MCLAIDVGSNGSSNGIQPYGTVNPSNVNVNSRGNGNANGGGNSRMNGQQESTSGRDVWQPWGQWKSQVQCHNV